MAPAGRYRTLVVLISGLLAAVAPVAGTALPSRAHHAPAAHIAAPAVAGLTPRAYLAQRIPWTPCLDEDTDPGLPPSFYTLQCGTFRSPLDWRDPSAAGHVDIAVTRLPASVRPARGALFTNPGGPGAAGRDMPLLFPILGRDAITRTQDVYGMDVRGTGGSTNTTCGGTSTLLLDPRDRRQATIDAFLASADFSARLCHVAGGPVADHVTTFDTVHDIDLLRSLVGAPKLNWIGYSAGTWLGAFYATYFPHRVGRFVLDSNVDFTGSWQQAFGRVPAAMQRRFAQDFLPWVAASEVVYGLGDTPAAVTASYERIRRSMVPTAAGDSAVLLDNLIANAMYSKIYFDLAAATLSDLSAAMGASRSASAVRARAAARARLSARYAAGTPGARLMAAARRGVAGLPFSTDAQDATYEDVTCNDTSWSGDRAWVVENARQQGTASPLVGWQQIWQPCLSWHRDTARLPVAAGPGVPVLMVNSEHDPVTPLEGAQRAARRFAGARLLTVTGEGDHGIYAGDNACVDAAVEKFLTTGILPAVGATCAGVGLPSVQGVRASARRGSAARAANPLVALAQLRARVRLP